NCSDLYRVGDDHNVSDTGKIRALHAGPPICVCPHLGGHLLMGRCRTPNVGAELRNPGRRSAGLRTRVISAKQFQCAEYQCFDGRSLSGGFGFERAVLDVRNVDGDAHVLMLPYLLPAMMRISLLAFGLAWSLGFAADCKSTVTGELQVSSFPSKTFGDTATLRVWLGAGGW